MSDEPPKGPNDESDDEFNGEGLPDPFVDEHESRMIEQDLADLENFEAAFDPEGYRGVAVWCHDCGEDHYYPWEMLRENLNLLLETGETPVHEPAFAPEPDRYIPWEYARGYVDALRDAGVNDRIPLEECNRCGLALKHELRAATFCPRCGTALVAQRLGEALRELGLDEDQTAAVLRSAGFAIR